MDDLKERLRANGLDECDEAITRIEALEACISKADALAKVVDEIAELASDYSPLTGHAIATPISKMADDALAAYREGSET